MLNGIKKGSDLKDLLPFFQSASGNIDQYYSVQNIR